MTEFWTMHRQSEHHALQGKVASGRPDLNRGPPAPKAGAEESNHGVSAKSAVSIGVLDEGPHGRPNRRTPLPAEARGRFTNADDPIFAGITGGHLDPSSLRRRFADAAG